nr:DUF3343 domain-containing protein [uncultured Agathobaculum sp.]
MSEFIATFHTHLSAMLSFQALQNAGCQAKMQPVPRVLSSSCGTCVRFSSEADCRDLLDADAEALYAVEDGSYRLLWQNED